MSVWTRQEEEDEVEGGRTAGLNRGRHGERQSETENGIRERERSRVGGGAERGWIKASTRDGNKERTKKVEEVGGGGWVPWSALIGSTWSDEKFNHPPIPTSPNSSSVSTASPSIFLSCSLFASSTLSRSLDSHQMNLPHISTRRCLHVSTDRS